MEGLGAEPAVGVQPRRSSGSLRQCPNWAVPCAGSASAATAMAAAHEETAALVLDQLMEDAELQEMLSWLPDFLDPQQQQRLGDMIPSEVRQGRQDWALLGSVRQVVGVPYVQQSP